MRFVVCFFGLIACTLTVVGGGILIGWDSMLGFMRENFPPEWKVDELPTTSMTGVTHANAGLFVAVAGLYGLLGSLLVAFRCGRQGGSLMIIPVLFAALLNPYALVFMVLQMLIGFLALFFGPLPIEAPKDEAEDDEDEDEDEDDEEEEEEDEDEEEEVKPKARKKR